MYDPLNNGFADDANASWPSTPHRAAESIPNMPRPATPRVNAVADMKGPTTPQGREPQVYGQPEPGLVSPRTTTASNGTSFEKMGEYLRVRITGLERNRRDILVRFDSQTNLSNFTGTTYRNVQRSYLEFQQLCEALVHSCPQTIIPALPFAQTSAPTDEEDDRLVKIMLQRWITRVCEDPILLRDEELRAFVESDFGYQPTPRPRKKTGSGFSLIRRGVPDEDEELQKARFELTKLEGQFSEAAKAIDKLTRSRKTLAQAHSEMGNKLINVATTEAHIPLANAMRKLGRTWHSMADIDQAQAISECVILGDSLGYQGLNSHSAKETLQMRTAVLEEYQAAVKTTISKRRNIERLKASSNIRPEKVDEALEDMEEASKYEQVLQKRAEGISQNLHRALETHRQLVTDDITTALIEHVRSSIMYEKQLLRELESTRVEVSTADAKALPTVKASAAPRPTIVPPLEDFNAPRVMIQPPPTQAPNTGPLGGPLGGTLIGPPVPPLGAKPATPTLPPTPVSARAHSPAVPPHIPGASAADPLSITEPNSPALSRGSPLTPNPPLSAGRAMLDGSQSVFLQSSQSVVSPPLSPALSSGVPATNARSNLPPPPRSPLPSIMSASQPAADPLARPAPIQGGAFASPLGPPAQDASPRMVMSTPNLDPLGQMQTGTLTGSVRLPPNRSRLDAREAASKLANMF